MLFGCCVKNPEDMSELHSMGYDYFEFSGSVLAAMSDEDFAGLQKKADELKFTCRAINAYCSGIPAIVGPRYSPEAAEEYARRICARAGKLGVATIGIGAPKARCLPEGYEIEKAHEQCRDFLRISCAVAAEYGISLLLESVHDRACNYLNFAAEAIAMAKELNIPNLKLVLDFYHMELMGEGLELVSQAAPLLLHTHISTCGESLSRSFPQEDEREKYTAIFAALKETGYDKSMSIEPDNFERDKAVSCLAMLRQLDKEL